MIYWFLYIFVYFSLILPYYAVKKGICGLVFLL